MVFNRIFLIEPFVPQSKYLAGDPPVGLGYIAQVLYDNNISYDIFDMRLNNSFNILKKKINDFAPDLIAIHMKTFMYKYTYDLISKIKKIKSIKILVGGPHVSTFREKLLKDCNSIDFGIVLEGEETIIDLIKGKNIKNIKGLIYRKNDKIIFNGERPFLDLNKVNFPKYHHFNIEKYSDKIISIVTSRGCPYQCIYCSSGITVGRKFRVRSAKHVVNEIEYWYKRGYTRFDIIDDNFTLIENRIFEICDEIEKREMKKKINLVCANGVRVDKITRKMLERMKDVGFSYISFGVEGGNNKILKILKRGETIEQVESAIKDACEIGFNVALFFLVGSPGETTKDIEDSIKLANKYPLEDVRFYNIIPYPKTELFDYLTKRKLFVKKYEDYLNDVSDWINEPVYSTRELSVNKKKEILKKLNKFRKEIRRKSYEKKLLKKKLGFIAKPFSYFIVSDFNKKYFLENKILRKYLLYLSKKII